MADAPALEPTSPFAGALAGIGVPASAGVTVGERRALQVATVIWRDDVAAIARHLREAYGVKLVPGPKLSVASNIAVIGTGPRSWLVLRKGGDPLVESLQQVLGASAAVSDQSSGYAILRISGSKARAMFEKGLGIDLHPRTFQPEDAAATHCAHLSVIIWQIDDAPTYEIALFRSVAAAFCHWLMESAAEFGLRVEPSA